MLHTDVFYRPQARRYNLSTQLASVLQKFLGKHLKAPLGVIQYRHLAAALGRHLLAVEIDADEDAMTTGMDATAGRTTSVSESVYALSNDMIGTLNDRNMAMSRASARLWQSGLFKLPLKGAIATAGQIEAPTVDLNVDGSLNATATSSIDQTTLLHSIETLFSKLEASLLEKLASRVAPQQPGPVAPPSFSPSPSPSPLPPPSTSFAPSSLGANFEPEYNTLDDDLVCIW